MGLTVTLRVRQKSHSSHGSTDNAYTRTNTVRAVQLQTGWFSQYTK